MSALWTVAGDLTTDNLNVNKDATFWGNVTVKDPTQGSAPTNGLVLYYRFSTNATPVADDSGNGNTGTVYGATWISNGVTDGAYSLDGVNDYIQTPYNAMLKPATNGGAISLWVNGRDFGTYGTKVLYMYGNTAADSDYTLIFHSSGIIYGVWRKSGDWPGSSLLSTGVWHHIVFSVDSNRAETLYVDGQVGATGTYGGGGNVGDWPTVLGTSAGWPSSVWYHENGSLDQVRVYNRPLTAAEVQGLYLNDAHLTAGTARFETGVSYVKPVGDLPMGSYTNSP